MQLLTETQIASFCDFIDRHDFFYICGHKEPDGDCICSCIALGMLVQKKGKEFQLLSAGPFKRTEIKRYEDRFSPSMRFLSEEERKKSALIITDCSEYARLGDIDGDLKNLDTCVIDHHKTASAPEGALCIIDSSSPAACAIVQLLYESVAGSMPKETAEILFTGLCTDTGFFRFLESDSAEVFKAASRLVSSGANPRATYDFITGGKPYDTRKLLASTLSRAERYLDGKLIVTSETTDDTQKWGAEGRDSDALYTLLLAVEKTLAVVFVRQESEHSCTIGFRSRGNVDVSAVAAKFGGGGHKNASGASSSGKIDTLIPQIVKEFARVL
ncbi:DHH family phosphoesterase [Treponema socranskii]|uniref:DHH family phosphoesterase n=1 Tax=Treponema socranskii TaxID=53419 RepID=UPI003D70117F